MKQLYRVVFAALFLLAGAATGSWAENPGEGHVVYSQDGTAVIIPPDYGAVILPVISSMTAKSIAQIMLTINLVDGSDKAVLPPEQLLWREGSWKNRRANVMSQVLFPLKAVNYLKDPKHRYKLEYTVSYRKASKDDKALVYLPLGSGLTFWMTAAYPFDLVSIDAGKLQWAADPADGGLLGVSWKIKKEIAGGVKTEAGAFSRKGPQNADVWVNKADGITAEVIFTCALNARQTRIPWADNGKDLRKLPSGLSIVLTQPDCLK